MTVMVQLARDYMEGKRVPTEYLMRKSEEAVLMYKGEEVRVDKIAFEKLILKRKRKLERGCATDSSSDDDSSSELELSPKCESA